MMLRTSSELRTAARQALAGKWGGAVIVTLLYIIIMGVLPVSFNVMPYFQIGGAGILGNVFQLFLFPIAYGYMVMFLSALREENFNIGALFDGFKDYIRIWGTLMLMGIYVFLWCLLLYIPGLIKSYSYSMTYYVLKDNPDMKFNAAIERSMAMMKGHKADLFYLHLSFIGWGLLCILTLGIGYLWLMPYTMSAQACFYEGIKAEYEAKVQQ